MDHTPGVLPRHVDVLDETYDRLRSTGPEFRGWLSNHGPMAADALVRLGCGEQVQAWVDGYALRLDEAPAPRWVIEEADWREVLGDPSRLGDWCALFDRQLDQEPWREVLVRWWPRLLDGAAASAAHGLIRTGHAVRALLEQPTAPRQAELAQALGYWAARHHRLPAHPRPGGVLDPATALDAMPSLDAGADGGFRTRIKDLARTPSWPVAVAQVRSAPPAGQVPAALDTLVDEAVTRYRRWAHGDPVMHAATAPRAASLVLPALPERLWTPTYEAAWALTAAISSIYRPLTPPPPPGSSEQHTVTPEQVTSRAVDTGDAHAIKFVEVAQESHRRGNPHALAAGARAGHQIAPDDAEGRPR